MTTINPAIVASDPALYEQFRLIRENQLSLLEALSSLNQLFNADATKVPTRSGIELLNKFTLPAKVAITAGQLVSIVNDAGVAKFDLALATAKPTHGYCISGGAAGASITVVLFDGLLAGTGLTVGTKYYTSNSTGGAITATNTGTDHCIGIALSTTQILFHTRGIF